MGEAGWTHQAERTRPTGLGEHSKSAQQQVERPLITATVPVKGLVDDVCHPVAQASAGCGQSGRITAKLAGCVVERQVLCVVKAKDCEGGSVVVFEQLPSPAGRWSPSFRSFDGARSVGLFKPTGEVVVRPLGREPFCGLRHAAGGQTAKDVLTCVGEQ
jgi:hypothetical protein